MNVTDRCERIVHNDRSIRKNCVLCDLIETGPLESAHSHDRRKPCRAFTKSFRIHSHRFVSQRAQPAFPRTLLQPNVVIGKRTKDVELRSVREHLFPIDSVRRQKPRIMIENCRKAAAPKLNRLLSLLDLQCAGYWRSFWLDSARKQQLLRSYFVTCRCPRRLPS